MDRQYLFISVETVDGIEKGSLLLIRQMPMIPAYQDAEAGDSRNGQPRV